MNVNIKDTHPHPHSIFNHNARCDDVILVVSALGELQANQTKSGWRFHGVFPICSHVATDQCSNPSQAGWLIDWFQFPTPSLRHSAKFVCLANFTAMDAICVLHFNDVMWDAEATPRSAILTHWPHVRKVSNGSHLNQTALQLRCLHWMAFVNLNASSWRGKIDTLGHCHSALRLRRRVVGIEFSN